MQLSRPEEDAPHIRCGCSLTSLSHTGVPVQRTNEDMLTQVGGQ